MGHMVLPALALALPLAAVISRLLKMSLKEVITLDYVTLARVRGFPGNAGHPARGAEERRLADADPGRVQFTFLIGGTVIVERLFSYEGLGNMAIDAVINRDLPLIQGIVLVFALLFVLINLTVDMMYALLNPRLRRWMRPRTKARCIAAPVAGRRLAAAGAVGRDLRATGGAAGPAGAGSDAGTAAALLARWRRARLLAGHRQLGRDLLSRLIFGGRIAFIVAFAAAIAACLVGSTLGLVAGYFGGWADRIISRIVDVWMAFPPVLFAILLVAVLGTGLGSVILAIAVIDWTRFCRVIRAEAMGQSRMDYVENARIAGYGRIGIMLREKCCPTCRRSWRCCRSKWASPSSSKPSCHSSTCRSRPTIPRGAASLPGPAVDPSGLVGAGVPADHADPDRAVVQPVRRGIEDAFRSGAAMSLAFKPCLDIRDLSAVLPNGQRVLRSVSLFRPARRGPRPGRRERRRQDDDRQGGAWRAAAERAHRRRRYAARGRGHRQAAAQGDAR